MISVSFNNEYPGSCYILGLLVYILNSIKWVSPYRLKEYEFCPADVPIVERLAKEN